ncbi:DNA recombination protein RmuC [Patescibacteria group bacterium]|nr:DNA recombination protein RmuC [Patescibacteria group bacterium]
MITTLLIILILLMLGFLIASFLFIRNFRKPKESGQDFLLIQNQINEMARTLDNKLAESNRTLQSQFGESVKIVKDVTERLTKLDETNKQVINFADQLRSLEDILKNPKQRGILGEYYLETLLKNVLPPDVYQMQYPFKNGEIVDAVVFVGRKPEEKIIPIDSKFSLENYNRLTETKDPSEKERLEKIFVADLKQRIVETSKYIRPEEGTTDFAFMFIPHEAIYYDLLINKVGAVTEDTENLIQRAAGKYKVIIVSPTSFLAYLQTVLQGLRALKIEESAKEIRKRVEELGKHIGTYETFMKKLGNNLGTTVNMYNSAYKELGKIDKDVLKITGNSNKMEPSSVEGPEDNE